MSDKHSPLRLFWTEFRENRIAVFALLVVILMGLLALFASLVSPQNPYDLANLSLLDSRRPPGFVGSGGYTHLLGTDPQGRDLLSAIFYGLRISIQIGLAAGFVSLTIGTFLGITAAYIGGRVEALIMRLVDLQLSFPAILLALVIVALLGQGKAQLIGALVAAQYAYFARTAYGAAKAERGKDYIEAAVATPLSTRLVVLRHLLPNCTPPLIVVATVQIANSISLEATLSFLGLGLNEDPSWGGMLNEALKGGRFIWWLATFPGLAIFLTVFAYNLIGEALRDAIDPHTKRLQQS